MSGLHGGPEHPPPPDPGRPGRCSCGAAPAAAAPLPAGRGADGASGDALGGETAAPGRTGETTAPGRTGDEDPTARIGDTGPADPSDPAALAALAAADEERAVQQALALVGRPTAPRGETEASATDRASARDRRPDAARTPRTPPAPRTTDPRASATPPGPGPNPGPRPGPSPAGDTAPDSGPRPAPDSARKPAPDSGPRPAPNSAPHPRSSPATAAGSPYPGSHRGTAPGTSSATPIPRAGAVPWAVARGIAARAGRAVPARAERLSLGRALGHVLAEPLAALTDLPPFDTSAMDGWAVAGPGPWRIRPDAGVLAGGEAPEPLPDGEAVPIATGARIPADATAVIRSEHAESDQAKGLLYAGRQVSPGQDIRPRGQECRSGDELLPAGTLVTPAVLGLAAAAGYDGLPARPRPRVEVLVLGDELLTAGLPRDGLIRDALGPMIGPWLHARGAEVAAPRWLGDDAEALLRALTGSEADLIVTTGGTAAGPVDHVHPVLGRIGAELLVDGVAVRPGHPMLLARLPAGGPYLVGLPGNPLAAVSGLVTLAEPLLDGLAGRYAEDPYRVAVRDEVQGHPHDTRLVPVVHRTGPAPAYGGRTPGGSGVGSGTGRGGEHVVPLRYNGPAMLRGIAAADGLAVVEPGGVRSGTEVEILDLPWAPATPWTEGCFT